MCGVVANSRVVSTPERYRQFVHAEAHGESDRYEEWALGVAGDLAVQARDPDGVRRAVRDLGVLYHPGHPPVGSSATRWPRSVM
jgi:hypothetical protein